MEDLNLFDEDGKRLTLTEVLAMLPKNHLQDIVVDCFVTHNNALEWNDGDTIRLIVRKIINNEPIEHQLDPLEMAYLLH